MMNGIGKIRYVSMEETYQIKISIAVGKKKIKTMLNRIPECSDRQ